MGLLMATKKRKKTKEKPAEKPWYKFWPEGVPKHVDYPAIPLSDFLKNTVQKYPNNIAISYFDRQITYTNLNGYVDKFPTALNDLGVKKGDKVALFLPNI